jgi:hypothetical protein
LRIALQGKYGLFFLFWCPNSGGLKMSQGFLQGLVIFFLFMITLAINVDDNVLARMGFSNDYLMVTLVSMVVAALLAYRHLALIVLVLFLSLTANAPADFLLNFGMNRDLILGTLVAIVIAPIAHRYLS